MMYYSSWWKLKVAVSWLLRYKRYLKDKILQRRESSLTKQGLEERRGHFALDELREAEHEILGRIQTREVIALQSEEEQRLVKRLMKKMGASISKFNPRVQWRLLRVRGRIGEAPLSYDLKHLANFTLQASCHRPDHQRRSPETGTHGSRVSFVILEA